MLQEVNKMTQNSDTTHLAKQCKYRPEYCQKLIDHLRTGLSMQTFGGTIGVTRSTVYKWIDEIPEFAEAHDIGLQLAQDFFEKRLVAKVSGQNIPNIDQKKIDTQALMFALKTRFHETYADKHDSRNISELRITKEDTKLLINEAIELVEKIR